MLKLAPVLTNKDKLVPVTDLLATFQHLFDLIESDKIPTAHFIIPAYYSILQDCGPSEGTI